MAFVVGELVAPVSLDPKPFEKGLGETKKKGENWAKDMGKSWSKAGEGIEKVGKKWTTGVTLPIVGAGAAVIATAANFESSMNRVRGLTGATGDDFEKLRDQARELGATTQYSASEAADGMGFLAMAGFKTNEILGAMPSVLELAASAQMDLASAADITSNILTGYGKDVSELGHVNDVLVKAMTSANVDLNMLGESLKYVGPVASGVGMDFEEVAAAVGLMGNAGIQGSMAGTSLRQAITALINPTKQAKGIMQELGLEATDSEGNLKSLTEIVRGLEESGATAADMMALFGQRAGPAMVSLVEQGSDALGDFTANLKDSEGAAKAIAEVNMQGAKGAFLELKSAGEELALSIADSGILKQITDIAKGAADWLRETSKTNPELLKMGVNLALTAAAAGPLISTTGKITKGVGDIRTLIGKLNPKLGKAAGGLASAGGAATGAGTSLAALGAAAGPIAIVAGGLVALAITTKQNRDYFNELTIEARDLDKAIADAGDAFEDAQEKFDDTASSTIAAAELADAYIDRLVELEEAGLDTAESQREYRGIVERLNELIPDLNVVIDEQTGLIVGGTDALRDNTQAWKDNVIAQAMQEKLKEEIAAHTDALIELTKSKYRYAEIEEELAGLIGDQASVVKDLARELGISEEETRKMLGSSSKLNGLLSRSGAVGDLTEDYLHFGRSIGETRTKLEELAESIRDGEATAADLAKELNTTEQAVQDFLDSLDGDPIEGTREKLGELDDEIVNAGKNARTAAEGAGESIGQGMADGLDSKRKAVAAAAKGLADSATQQIRGTLQIASPSKVAMGWGKNIAEGLAIGMGDSGILQDASIAMADMMIPTPQSTSSNSITNTVPIYITIQGDVTKDALPKLSDAFSRPVGKILQERGVVGGFR